MKDYIRKLRRNVKAISPIFAVLILIAIAVIGGIVIYMFTSGYLGTMMGGGSAGQEKLAIQTVTVGTTDITVYVKSTGGGNIVVTDAILKDSSGNTVGAPITLGTPVNIPADGTLTAVTVGVTPAAGYTYTVTLVSQVGNQFVSPSFKG